MQNAATAQSRQPVVAILNTSIDMIDVMTEALTTEGYRCVSALIREFRLGERDIRTFFAKNRPQVVLYDIAIPYVENWRFFQEEVLSLGLLPPSCFIVTTTNRSVLDVLVGSTHAFELVGRPADLDVLVQLVHQAVRS